MKNFNKNFDLNGNVLLVPNNRKMKEFSDKSNKGF